MSGNRIVVPDTIEPIIGYKALLVGQWANPRLLSPVRGFQWPTGTRAIAQCPYAHKAPVRMCHCGIYVVRDAEQLIGYYGAQHVVVEVALWGRVIQAERGARGQFAYPQRIVDWSINDALVEEISAVYGIPISTETNTQLKKILQQTLALEDMKQRLAVGGAPFRQLGAQPATLNAPATPGAKTTTAVPRPIFEATAVSLMGGGGAIVLGKMFTFGIGLTWWVICATAWIIYCVKGMK